MDTQPDRLQPNPNPHSKRIVQEDDSDESMYLDSYKNIPSSETDSIEEDTSWPIVTYFILFVEFCERFCYYGFRSILVLYIQEYFGFKEADASQLYHVFGLLVYFFPIVGAVISDSYWGRFNTIWRFCCVYFVGLILLTISAVPTWFMEASGPDRTIHQGFSYIGLFLIAVGSGGIKPCVSSFGADQFRPHQAKAKESYFKWFYMLINLGAIVSAWLTPVLKSMDCYSETSKDDSDLKLIWTKNNDIAEQQRTAFDSCHYLSYLVPTVLMFIGICTFLLPSLIFLTFRNKNYEFAATYKYRKEPHRNNNILFKFIQIIGSALANLRSGFQSNRDKAEEGFIRFSTSNNGQMRRATWRILQIAALYIPLVFFWAIMEQIGSLWTFQAKELNGWTGGYYTQADQVEVLNNIFVVILIPVWTLIFLPLLKASPLYKSASAKKNMPLHMMATGLFLTALSQFVAWRLQLALNSSLTFSENNPAYKPVKLVFGDEFSAEKFGFAPNVTNKNCGQQDVEAFRRGEVFDGQCWEISYDGQNFPISSENKDPVIAWFHKANETTALKKVPGALTNQQLKGPLRYCRILNSTKTASCTELKSDEAKAERLEFRNGATYIEGDFQTEGRTLSVAYIVPQYFILTFGEVLLSTTALEFSYTQAPSSVKAISTALWYCTTAFANLVVILLKSMKSLSRDTQLLCSAFMVVAAMIGFIAIGWNFTVYSQHDIDRLDRDDSDSGSSEQDPDTSRTPMIKNSNA